MKFPSDLYTDEKKFNEEAHKYLIEVFQSSIYDPEIVSKLASMEERALNQVLLNLSVDERKEFLDALDSAADKHVIERILSNATDAIGIGFKNVKAQNSHLLDVILFGGSIGILPVAYLQALSEDMPWLMKIPYMVIMLPVAAAILVAEAIIAAAVFIAASPVVTAWSFISGIRAHYTAQNSEIDEKYKSLKEKSHSMLDEKPQEPAPQDNNSPSFLSSLIKYLAVQPNTSPGRTHRFFSVSGAEGAQAKEDIEDMRPWLDSEIPKLT